MAIRRNEQVAYQRQPATGRRANRESADNRCMGLPHLRVYIEKIINGTPDEKKALANRFFFVSETPAFMQALGLRGEYFSAKYGVLSRHNGKDAGHNLTPADWVQLCDAIREPFAITKHADGFNIFTAIKVDNHFVMVGVVVKSMGKNMEVNAIRTVFSAKTLKKDAVVYTSKSLTPEQEALLGGTNFHPYQPVHEGGGVPAASKSADTLLSPKREE